MQTIINKAIEQINQGTEWVLNNAKAEKMKTYKALVKERRTLKKINRTYNSKTTVVLFGQSQCGKSHLSSSLLSVDGKPLLVVDRMNGVNYKFLTRLNPTGDGEATGLITRFTTQHQEGVTKEYPVHIKLMSIKDLVLMICDGYYKDVSHREPFEKESIQRLIDELRKRKKTQRQSYITEDDLGEIEDYFSNVFSKDLIYSLYETDYFGELSLMIEYLDESDVVKALNLFWNNDPNLSDIFSQLFAACKKLEFSSDAFISFDELDNTKGTTLLYVGWHDLTDTQTQSHICYKDANGVMKEVSLGKTFLATICAEVVLEVLPPAVEANNDKTNYIYSILESVDVLDFPGARSRDSGILSTAGNEGQLLRRGKVGYYFNNYSAERRINSLLFCWEPNNFDAKPMQNVIRNWIDVAIGKNEEERSLYMSDMQVAPLFFVGTKYNKVLRSKTEEEGTDLDGKWFKWFVEQLSQDVIGMPKGKNVDPSDDNFKWFESWTKEHPYFDNIYLLRDFRYSTDIYEGWTESSGSEIARLTEPYPNYYEKMRTSFVNYPFVQKHVRDASKIWSESSEANCDGSLPIARNLASIVKKIAVATAAKNQRDVVESIRIVICELRKHYYNTDTAVALEKALASAARLQASLDYAYGRDAYYFGRFMKALTITEYAVHEEFSDILGNFGNIGGLGDYVFIYMRAPELKPARTFEENLEILRKAYGFANAEETKQYFVEELEINLEDLFLKSDIGLESPSQKLSALLKDYWFNTWLRAKQKDCLCAMLHEGSYNELVDMLESLYDKYEMEKEVAKAIHNYVDSFGVNVKALSEMIADVCAEIINKFVLSVGYDYYSEKDGVVKNLKDASAQHGIGLDFQYIEVNPTQPSNKHIAEVMEKMDDKTRTQRMVAHPNDYSVGEVSEVIQGFRQSCRWRDLAKIGYVLTKDIPHYDVEANNRLGKIIENCESLNK